MRVVLVPITPRDFARAHRYVRRSAFLVEEPLGHRICGERLHPHDGPASSATRMILANVAFAHE